MLFSDVVDVQELKSFGLKIAFWRGDKWKKDKVISETSLTLITFLQTAKSGETSQTLSTCEITMKLEPKKKRSDKDRDFTWTAKIHFDVSGWRLIYDLLSEEATIASTVSRLYATSNGNTNTDKRNCTRSKSQ